MVDSGWPQRPSTLNRDARMNQSSEEEDRGRDFLADSFSISGCFSPNLSFLLVFHSVPLLSSPLMYVLHIHVLLHPRRRDRLFVCSLACRLSFLGPLVPLCWSVGRSVDRQLALGITFLLLQPPQMPPPPPRRTAHVVHLVASALQQQRRTWEKSRTAATNPNTDSGGGDSGGSQARAENGGGLLLLPRWWDGGARRGTEGGRQKRKERRRKEGRENHRIHCSRSRST